MKLRLAKKIVKAVSTDSERCYSQDQIGRAADRIERTKSARADRDFFNQVIVEIGVLGRARVLDGSGAPGMAFDLLMRTPEGQWDE